jgi:hypothetical protein
MKQKRVTVADLPTRSTDAFLLCPKCHAQCSADAGDYWDRPKDHVFKCCGRNMRLVTARTVYEDVKP